MAEESKIDAAEKMKSHKKSAVAYLKDRAQDLDASLARNFASGHYSIAAQDAKQLAAVMEVLGQIDLNS
jgi:hypothetical protein